MIAHIIIHARSIIAHIIIHATMLSLTFTFTLLSLALSFMLPLSNTTNVRATGQNERFRFQHSCELLRMPYRTVSCTLWILRCAVRVSRLLVHPLFSFHNMYTSINYTFSATPRKISLPLLRFAISWPFFEKISKKAKRFHHS